ncbi:MAG TPA: hypothetical protein VG013_20645 [Gemmataceae bacterium]|jgi:hypothetical protein|nr:hypothetical protein [Gemmataceae bacterium]
MRAGNNRFAIFLAVLIAAGFQGLGGRPAYLWAAPQAGKLKDWVQLNFAGGAVSGTGVKGKGGFTIVPMEDKAIGLTKVVVSFALTQDKRGASDFQVVAVDRAGNRHDARAQSGVSAGGKGVVVVTLVSEFNLASDKIKALVVPQRAGK